MRTNDLKARAASLQVKHRVAQEHCKNAQSTLTSCEDDFTNATEALVIVKRVAAAIQKNVHDKISGIVSQCLATVWEDPYEFKIHFREGARGGTEAHIVFVRDDQDVDPLTASGGSVVDVAAFALRVASLMLSRPPKRRIALLDEPFKFVSADRRPRVRLMLEKLAAPPPAGLGVQFVMVTHIRELMCGKIVTVGEQDDRSE